MDKIPERPEAVMFDSDGLVFDTGRQWRAAEMSLFSRHGVRHDKSASDALFGSGRAKAEGVIRQLFSVNSEEAVQLFEQLEDLVIDQLAARCDLKRGAAQVVRHFRQVGIPTGLASNSSRRVLEAALGHLPDGDDWFDATVSGDEVLRPKPAPDIYVDICTKLFAEPTRCIAFEDSPTGAISAKQAGLFVVFVPSRSTSGTDEHFDLTVKSLDAPDLLNWLPRG